jgi:hypothetical protein|nr:MAG TPA: hypothetical protein [Caudoviricetes sp.]
MNTIVIYGAYAEGFVFKGSTELKPMEPCSSICDVKEAYASINIDITGGIPVVLNLNNGAGFAPGFIVRDVTYLHFPAGHVPDDILVREA